MATTTTRAQAGNARPRSHANTLLWAVQILLAAVFAVAVPPSSTSPYCTAPPS